MLEKGFYYHYKHDSSGPSNNAAYEVLGVALGTENESQSVLYRPLYENEYLADADCLARPLQMFLEEIEKDGKKMPRFAKISDPELLQKLEEMKEKMYPAKTRG